MAKKKGKDTLKDLNAFMQNREGESSNTSKEFIQQSPKSLAEVEKIGDTLKKMEELPADALKEKEISALILKLASAQKVSPQMILYKVFLEVQQQSKQQAASDLFLENLLLFLQYHEELVGRS